MKKILAIIVACIAGGYTGFCIGFIALCVDAAWKGVLQSGYEAEFGIFVGIFCACIAGALGGVAGIGRLGAYFGSLGFGAFFVSCCWCFLQNLSLRHLQITVADLIVLIDVALAGVVGVVVAKRMASRPRLQFRLKTLLVLVMMCAVACGLVGVRGQQRKQWREQEVAAARKEQWQVLAKLQHFQCFPEWGAWDNEGHVVRLRLVAIPPVQDNELRDDLAHLKDLAWLRGLQSLDLRETQVSDQGLAHLSELTNVQELNLNETKVTDAGLVFLKGPANLETLSLHATRVTDAGLEHLKGLTTLRYLTLKNTQVTDGGLESLKGSTELEGIRLSDTQVTDAGLKHLAGLSRLKHLGLRGTQVTDEGVQKLQQALPDCKIEH